MSTVVSQITFISIACSTTCSGTDQRKHQSSTSLAFMRGIHHWPVDSPHKGPVTRKMFPFENIIMTLQILQSGGSIWPSGRISFIRTPKDFQGPWEPSHPFCCSKYHLKVSHSLCPSIIFLVMTQFTDAYTRHQYVTRPQSDISHF